MTSQSSLPGDPEDSGSPLRDRAGWDRVIEMAGPKSLKKLIEAQMGRRLRAYCEVEDIWQETLKRAWNPRARHEWRGIEAFQHWLLEIAKNSILDAVRRMDAGKRGGGRRTKRIPGPESHSSGSGVVPHDSVTPSEIAMERERQAVRLAALAAVPARYREVVRMSLIEELPIKVIAESLEISESTARERLRKGRLSYFRALNRGDSNPGRP
jgi:RNA polymerase sigma-70 factor, ECF subfamily